MRTKGHDKSAFLSSFFIAVTLSVVALQIFPLFKVGGTVITLKYAFVSFLMAYFYVGLVLLEKGKLPFERDILLFGMFYFLSAVVLAVSVIVQGAKIAMITPVIEFLYLIPLLFSLYLFFVKHIHFNAAILTRAAWVMYLCVVGFIVFFALSADVKLIEVFAAFFAGESTLQSKLFSRTFSHIDENAGSSARHAMMFMFYLLLVSTRIYRDLESDRRRSRFTLLEGFLIFTIVVIGMSRKVSLCVLAFYCIYFTATLRFKSDGGTFSKLIVGLMASVVIGVIVYGISSLDAEALALLKYKYVDNIIHNDRFHQFHLALIQVNQNWQTLLFGVGLGNRIAGDDHFPHNILFFFLHQTGIVGLIPALFLYTHMLFMMISSLVNSFKASSRYHAYISIAIFSSLLIPFFRLSSGDKGGLAMEGLVGLVWALILKKNLSQYQKDINSVKSL